MTDDERKTLLEQARITSIGFSMMGDRMVLAATFQQLAFLMMTQGILEEGIKAAQALLDQDRMPPGEIDLGNDDATSH